MSSSARDITGERHGRLTAREFSHVDAHGDHWWWFECDHDHRPEHGLPCRVVKRKAQVVQEQIRSCGCLQREAWSGGKVTHGHSLAGMVTSEYAAWLRIRHYREGAVCSHWQDFAAFLKDVGPRPDEAHGLVRADPDLPWGPGNTLWRPTPVKTRAAVRRWECRFLLDVARRLGIAKE